MAASYSDCPFIRDQALLNREETMSSKGLTVIAAILTALVSMLFLLALLGAPLSGRAITAMAAPNTDHTVCPAGPPTCDYSIIQDAVDAAAAGDNILVATGIYSEINYTNELAQVVYLDKSVSIQGGYTTTDWTTSDPLAFPTTLDAGGQGRVLYITGDISPTIAGLRITGGDTAFLGTWENGGGVFIYSSTATLENNAIFSNTAHGGGGIWMDHSAAALANNAILSNTATDGGAIFMWQCDNASITGNEISHNTAVSYTGGLRSLAGDNIQIDDNLFSYNTGDWSGGLDLEGNGITLFGNTILSNTAVDHGGGLSLSGNIELVDNVISFNTAGEGGGGLVVSGGSPIFIRNMIAENQSMLGGGVQSFWSTPTFIDNTVSGNSADFGGGFAVGDGLLRANTFISNTATNQGGGLYLGESPVLSGNFISANSAQEGGGVFFNESDARLVNNVIYANSADFGSGLATGLSAPHLLHTTIANNTGGSGVGIFVSSGTLALTNTILVSHTVGIDVAMGSTATLEATLWYGNNTDLGGGGTVITGTINLWGNPAFLDPTIGDYHLGMGSPALDEGVDAGVRIDVDNQPRPYQAPDLGADEYWPPGTLKSIYLPVVLRE
jgi:hypothetical protein